MNEYLILVVAAANLAVALVLLYYTYSVRYDLKLKNGSSSEIKTIADGVESLLGEFLPKGGASISYRINDLLKLVVVASENAISAKQVAQSLTDTVARVEQGMAKTHEKIDSQTRLLGEQNKIINNIIQSSGEVGQLLAGKGSQDKT